VSAQKVINGKVGEGKQYRDFLILNNFCRVAARFRVKSKNKHIKFEQSTDSILIGPGGEVNLRFIFDAAGLENKTYNDKITIKCLDCEKEQGCRKDEETVLVRMTVVSVIEILPQRTPTPIPTPTPPDPPDENPESSAPTEGPTEGPTEEPTDGPTDRPTDRPVEAPDTSPEITPPPSETPAEMSPSTLSPTESPSATPPPAPSPGISQNSSPDKLVENNNLTYAVGLFGVALVALLAFILISSLIGKKSFQKWKYGNNAANLRALKKGIKAKEELANNWMKKRRSKNIHAIGVGKIDGTDNYCIQVFVENADGQMLENPPVQLLPAEYRNFPIFIFEMPRAVFLSGNYASAKDPHKTIVGGISGANTNLSNEFGTIGYFCSPTIMRPIRKFRKEVFLLSNAHVFANLSNPEKTVKDLIQQPSPGENKRHGFIASLEKYVPIKFDNDTEDPNFTDAAIARLFPNVDYKTEIPVIGKIIDHVPKERVELRQKCRKFGRTTGYSEGKIFSIHLSIWIRYGSTGRESFFKDQFLIVPEDAHDDFLQGGDSGSLVADHENNAIGLIFGGAGSNTKFGLENLPIDIDVQSLLKNRGGKIRNYGVANPICRVLKDLNVKLTL
jgi:hypothetical protein